MGRELKNGNTVESKIAPSLYKKFKAKTKKDKTSMAQVIRDHIQGYVKK